MKVKRYVQGYHYIEVDADELRAECHKEMREIAPDGTSEDVLFSMGEHLYKICTSPKV